MLCRDGICFLPTPSGSSSKSECDQELNTLQSFPSELMLPLCPTVLYSSLRLSSSKFKGQGQGKTTSSCFGLWMDSGLQNQTNHSQDLFGHTVKSGHHCLIYHGTALNIRPDTMAGGQQMLTEQHVGQRETCKLVKFLEREELQPNLAPQIGRSCVHTCIHTVVEHTDSYNDPQTVQCPETEERRGRGRAWN